MTNAPGTLPWQPARDHPELLAPTVAAALAGVAFGSQAQVASIDPDLADTAAFCARYDVALAASANCVVVAGRRGELTTYAACLLLATTRLDVNGVVRGKLGARKASFASLDDATTLTGMEYGGITVLGLPDWPVFIDEAVIHAGTVVIGSGLRRSKVAIDAALLAGLERAEIITGLARQITA
jgi:prolyl-tRNA editing enzyme YbaK/EbsC (Cys-tRNA(Pro) deacylase)